MIYCVKCINYRDAQDVVRSYIKEYKDRISEVRRHRAIPVIILKNKDQIHFVTTYGLKSWCLGKTYKFVGDDTTYHSGWPIKE